MVIFIAALFLASPQIKSSVTDYIYKTENTIGDRRSTQLEATISAAKHGGLIGLGYGISDPKNIIERDKVVGQRYYREKMISVLALVEEVGVIGLILFLAIIGYVFWLLFRTFNPHSSIHSFSVKGRSQSEADVPLEQTSGGLFRGQHSTGKWKSSFLIAVLVGLCFNAQIEGWWLGAGSWQFLLFFTIIGYSIAITSNSNRYNKINNENA